MKRTKKIRNIKKNMKGGSEHVTAQMLQDQRTQIGDVYFFNDQKFEIVSAHSRDPVITFKKSKMLSAFNKNDSELNVTISWDVPRSEIFITDINNISNLHIPIPDLKKKTFIDRFYTVTTARIDGMQTIIEQMNQQKVNVKEQIKANVVIDNRINFDDGPSAPYIGRNYKINDENCKVETIDRRTNTVTCKEGKSYNYLNAIVRLAPVGITGYMMTPSNKELIQNSRVMIEFENTINAGDSFKMATSNYLPSIPFITIKGLDKTSKNIIKTDGSTQSYADIKSFEPIHASNILGISLKSGASGIATTKYDEFRRRKFKAAMFEFPSDAVVKAANNATKICRIHQEFRDAAGVAGVATNPLVAAAGAAVAAQQQKYNYEDTELTRLNDVLTVNNTRLAITTQMAADSNDNLTDFDATALINDLTLLSNQAQVTIIGRNNDEIHNRRRELLVFSQWLSNKNNDNVTKERELIQSEIVTQQLIMSGIWDPSTFTFADQQNADAAATTAIQTKVVALQTIKDTNIGGVGNIYYECYNIDPKSITSNNTVFTCINQTEPFNYQYAISISEINNGQWEGSTNVERVNQNNLIVNIQLSLENIQEFNHTTFVNSYTDLETYILRYKEFRWRDKTLETELDRRIITSINAIAGITNGDTDTLFNTLVTVNNNLTSVLLFEYCYIFLSAIGTAYTTDNDITQFCLFYINILMSNNIISFIFNSNYSFITLINRFVLMSNWLNDPKFNTIRPDIEDRLGVYYTNVNNIQIHPGPDTLTKRRTLVKIGIFLNELTHNSNRMTTPVYFGYYQLREAAMDAEANMAIPNGGGRRRRRSKKHAKKHISKRKSTRKKFTRKVH